MYDPLYEAVFLYNKPVQEAVTAGYEKIPAAEACGKDAPRNSSNSSSSTSQDGSSAPWLWLFGLGSLILTAASAYALHATACAAVCSVTRLISGPEMPLRLAMTSAALLVALPQLLLVTCTLAWSTFVLLAPVVSSDSCIQRNIGKYSASERMSAVVSDATLVVACLAGLVVMMWSMNTAYDHNLPVSIVELVIFCAVMLTMSSMVVFWTADLCASIDDAFRPEMEGELEELQHVLCDGKDQQNAKLCKVICTAHADAV